MPRDPTDVGGAPVDVLGLVIEDVFEGGGGVQEVAAGGVDHSFGFSGGSTGVEHEKRIFGLHPFGVARSGRLGDYVVPPNVSA